MLFDEINGKSVYTDEFYYDEIDRNSTDTDVDEPDSDQIDETFLDEIEGNSTDTDIDEPDSDQTDAFFSDEIEGNSTDWFWWTRLRPNWWRWQSNLYTTLWVEFRFDLMMISWELSDGFSTVQFEQVNNSWGDWWSFWKTVLMSYVH